MSLTLLHDPYEMFDEWFQKAESLEPVDPNAMTLATVGADGRPSARTVLLKSYDKDGFVFYTNYNSRKARELTENPHAALLFYWKSYSRQIRIEGRIEKTSAAESDQYFNERPEISRLGAWASEQSSPLRDQAELLARVEEFKNEFSGQDIPRPPHWGGYRLKPDYFEFWQAGEFRLHERGIYQLDDVGEWQTGFLNP